MTTTKGERLLNDALDLENRLLNRQDYGDDDITIMSNLMDFIVAHKGEFIEYFQRTPIDEQGRE